MEEEILLEITYDEKEWLFNFMEANEMTVKESLITFLRYCRLVNILQNSEEKEQNDL